MYFQDVYTPDSDELDPIAHHFKRIYNVDEALEIVNSGNALNGSELFEIGCTLRSILEIRSELESIGDIASPIKALLPSSENDIRLSVI